MTVSAILLSSVLTFPGGTDGQLSSWLARNSGRDYAILYDPNRRWAAFTAPAVGEQGTLKELAKGSGISFAFGGVPGDLSTAVQPKWWPLYTFWSGYVTSLGYAYKEWAIPKEAVSGHRFATPATSFTSLRGLSRHWKGKLKYHWFFESARFVFDCESDDPEVVLPSVAKAVGGRITGEIGSRYIDLDYAELRRRAVGLAQYAKVMKKDDPALACNLDYTAEAYRTLSDVQLKKLYEAPDSLLEIHIASKSKLMELGKRRLDTLYPITSQDGNTMRIAISLENDIDWDRGMGLFITPRNSAASYVYYKQGASDRGAKKLVL